MLQVMDYGDHLDIIVEDNGKGFDIDKMDGKNGIGLKSILSRVNHLRGDIEWVSNSSDGTSVSVNIPYSTTTS